MRRASLLALALAALAAPSVGSAHSRSISYSIWTVDGPEMHLYVELTALDVIESVLVDLDRDGTLSREEAFLGQGLVAGMLEGGVRLRNRGKACPPSAPVEVEIPDPPANLYLRQSFRCEDVLTDVDIHWSVHESIRQSMHRNLANFKLPRDRTATTVFASSAPDHSLLVEQPPEQTSTWGAFRVFLRLGAEHILTGYDHLLFLLSLLLLWPSLRSLLAIITSFTLAHSVTLALAALDVVVLPERLTESVIALSIAYVAVENLWVREAPWRWVITLAFGLIHGFGFSGVLRELGLPKAHLLTSLISFNLGVELGQLGVVLPFTLLVLVPGRRLADRTRRRMTVGASLAIFLVGMTWFVQRAFLG